MNPDRCPFCGHTSPIVVEQLPTGVRLQVHIYLKNIRAVWFRVECQRNKCTATGPRRKTAGGAAVAWNRAAR